MPRRVPPVAPVPDTVDLPQVDFAELLGLTESDAPFLATAPVRLRRSWVEGWKSRMGVRELTASDLCVVLGVCEKTVYSCMGETATPRLRHRLAVATVGKRQRRFVSPANLVLYLRERSNMAGIVPTIAETAGQRSKRARDAQARVAAMDAAGN